MNRLLSRLGLPLLAKELIEQSARRRTYVIRVVYALTLFFIAFLVFYEALYAGVRSPLAVLGSGKYLFNALVRLGYAGIYLFMPAITCSVITQEKERASLQLLFLTRLGPWTILFEKLLGRVVPMLGFLLLSLPLLGFAYTLGGISQELLWTGVWFLVLAVFEMGTLALACSAFCRTTFGSFVASYVLSFLLLFGPALFWILMFLLASCLGITPDRLFGGNSGLSAAMMLMMMAPFFGEGWFEMLQEFPGALGYWLAAAHSVVIVLVSTVSILVARYALVARAFVPARNRVREFFTAFDRQVLGIGWRSSAARGPAATDPAQLPADDPVAWRETSKRSLTRLHHLAAIMAAIEIPLLLACGLALLAALTRDGYVFGWLFLALTWGLLWVLSVLIISARATSLIAGERSHQTLDVLCTTPLTGREIVLQKMRAVRRLLVLFAVPFATLFLFQTLWMSLVHYRRDWGPVSEFNAFRYLVCSALGVAVYLPLTAWLSLLIGLIVRTQVRAIIGSLAAIVIGCAAPLVFIATPLAMLFPGLSLQSDDQILVWASLTSPAALVFVNEFIGPGLYGFKQAWLLIAVNFTVYGAAAVAIRQVCLRHADRWLGRSDPETPARLAQADSGAAATLAADGLADGTRPEKLAAES